MTQFLYFLAFLSILFISSGQILFKYVSILTNQRDSISLVTVILVGIFSFVISGIGTLIWMYVLKFVELNKVYPLMALSFVMVPVMSHYFYNDKISFQYIIGVFCIILGIVIITRIQS